MNANRPTSPGPQRTATTSSSSLPLSPSTQSKNAKKLQTFYKDKEKSSNKFKSIVSFIGNFPFKSCLIDLKSLRTWRKMKRRNSSPIITSLYLQYYWRDLILVKTPNLKKVPKNEISSLRNLGKGIKDLLSILAILKKLLTFLPALINTRWQIDKIGESLTFCGLRVSIYTYIGLIIEKCLWKGNPQQVRLAGFELLILFIEALQNSMENQQIELFANAINLVPFIPSDSKIVLKHNKFGSFLFV